jgi:hypothetical protein
MDFYPSREGFKNVFYRQLAIKSSVSNMYVDLSCEVLQCDKVFPASVKVVVHVALFLARQAGEHSFHHLQKF